MKVKLVIIIVCILIVLGIVSFALVISDKAKEAKNIALADAKVSEKDANYFKTSLDFDDLKLIYDLEFTSNNQKYEYEIDLLKGEIIARDFTGQNKVQSTNQDMAVKIALQHAKVPQENLDTIIVQEDIDDSVEVYEIEFVYDNYKYEYTVDKQGNIIEFDKEKMNF